jgi:hypothetical protein
MDPAYGLHTNAAGNVIAAKDFTHEYQCREWMRSLDVRPGDRIEFKALHVRTEDEPPLTKVEEAPPQRVQAESDNQPL